LVLTLRQIAMAAAAGDYDGAAQAYADYRGAAKVMAADLKSAEPWSLFNPEVREAHFTALRQLAELAR
jgi:hypothetical protein